MKNFKENVKDFFKYDVKPFLKDFMEDVWDMIVCMLTIGEPESILTLYLVIFIIAIIVGHGQGYFAR